MAEKKPRLTDASKKFKIQDLPEGIDRHIWRRIFVPTLMMQIARQDNPFGNNTIAICKAMQKIWDELSDTPHNIVHSSAIYHLVCIFFLVHSSLTKMNAYAIDYATCFRLMAQHYGLDSNRHRSCIL